MATTGIAPAKSMRGESRNSAPIVIKAETNFLRFPFFALSTKNIHQIDIREVTGTRTITGAKGESTQVDFSYRVSRNTDHIFPGQLSRNIHFALLSILAKQGSKFRNPIQFSWRQLAVEMGVSYGGGKMIKDMKSAIRSTHGTIIRTDQALIDGTVEDRPTIRRERGLQLYQDYTFHDEIRDDGSACDRNEITLSDWYFNNLQARYVQPLNFAVWQTLNRKTPIASRLYEYLTFVFGKQKFRRISYAKLAASIPLTEVREPARMKKQLTPALTALKELKLIKRVNWTTGKYGDEVLEFQKGDCFRSISSPFTQTNEQETILSTSQELNDHTPTDRIINSYYKLRFGTDHFITDKERKLVSQFVTRYGFERITEVIPKLARKMKREFPQGQSIMAAQQILELLLARKPETSKRAPKVKKETQEINDRVRYRERLEQQWQSLTEDQRQTVFEIVKSRLPSSDESSSGFQLMLFNEANNLFF